MSCSGRNLGWSFLAIMASAIAGSQIEVTAVRANAACDNACREKDAFKWCPTGKCQQYLYITCALCGGNGNPINGRCTDDGAVVTPNCVTKAGGNTSYSYDDCDPVCSCTGHNGYVEASFVGYTGASLPATYKVCSAAPEEPPGEG